MTVDQIVSIVVAILTGLAAAIPLAVKLIQYVEKAAKEKNWGALLGLVVGLMEEAEQKFDDGATRKEWVGVYQLRHGPPGTLRIDRRSL